MYIVFMKKKEAVAVLVDIRSTHNVGAIFRTSDACGVSKIYLAGYTPAPVDRFGRSRADVAKSALGAEKTINWEVVANISNIIKKLHKDGFKIIAIEQSLNSIDYKKIKIDDKVAFVVGNEVTGLPENILKKCDLVAEIPMLGEKESLNVSVAFGVAVFRMLNI